MNFKKSYLTSCIGAVIVIGGLVCLYMGKTDGVQAGLIIATGAGFFLSKDHDK